MARRSIATSASGPLEPLRAGFVEWLTAQGYVSTGLAGQCSLFKHLDRWLAAAGLGLDDLTSAALGEFLRARRADGYTTKLTPHGLGPLLGYLEHHHLYAPPPMAITTTADEIVDRFRLHLLDERALGEGTAYGYVHVARVFLATFPEPLEMSLPGLTAGDVTEFILARSTELGVSGMQTVVSGMRALLRFCYLTGLTERALAAAVPSVARRREELPRALSREHVERLLQGCDRTTPVGIRDFAVLTVLARLGLRCSEVASLQLDDIDWTAGQVRIYGKGPRQENLPLPTDVGEAIVGYLRDSRPACVDRRLFIRSCAPRRGLSRQAIGGLVRAASVRAELTRHGPHRLRHTVATATLREGANLAEIAQLLRHQSIQTTVIYAKVDHDTLLDLAQPWPGDAE
jgi:integrase/recombinase XerD